MLTGNNEWAPAATPREPQSMSKAANTGIPSGAVPTRLERVLRIEWLGQTAASVFWIGSVLAYGISSSGDWLQLFASSSWLLANVAEAVTIKAD